MKSTNAATDLRMKRLVGVLHDPHSAGEFLLQCVHLDHSDLNAFRNRNPLTSNEQISRSRLPSLSAASYVGELLCLSAIPVSFCLAGRVGRRW